MITSLIKKILAKKGYQVNRIQQPASDILPAFEKQKQLVDGISTQPVILDIGAHFGETAAIYQKLFPKATIYSFEPFQESFERLQKFAGAYPNITPVQQAFSNTVKSVEYQVNSNSATNSLFQTAPGADQIWGKNLLETNATMAMETTTLDRWVEQQNIDHIDLLKIDTQGSEYDILEGASFLLKEQRIKIIYMEILLGSTYIGQKSQDEILYLLRTNFFQLYNYYDTRFDSNGRIIQVDALFTHEDFFKKN